ncbi:MAG: hypothetical protein R3D62_19750 [Xanthobacteraceae bacterium]
MLRKFALVFAAGATIVAGIALAPTEASAWYGRCWGCGPYYYGRPYVVHPGYRYYRWRRPYYAYGWRPYYRPYYRPYWGWRRHWW